MSEVTENVVMDLLPLYLAGELSPDSLALVRSYIEAHPEMAEILGKMTKAESLEQIPAPFSREVAMEAFQAAKKWTVIQQLGLALIIGLCAFASFVLLLAFFYFMRYGSP